MERERPPPVPPRQGPRRAPCSDDEGATSRHDEDGLQQADRRGLERLD
jgi:hypothetical protein